VARPAEPIDPFGMLTLGDLLAPVSARDNVRDGDILADLVFRDAPRVTVAERSDQAEPRARWAVARPKPEYAHLAARLSYLIRGRSSWLRAACPQMAGWHQLSWTVLAALPVPASLVEAREIAA
jgi:hypothetical protein